jgi:CDP-glucose 4,6-dehydratase
MVDPRFWKARRVFLTGHTGFKGSWLALWLQSMEAELAGYALPPPTHPSLFDEAHIAAGMAASHIGDIRDRDTLLQALHAASPEIVFHLAAQPLVGEGYRDPIGTFGTNVMGTANLLEATRHVPSVRVVVVITTDKCYENAEWDWPYRETDALGGHDPYSSSKACAELVSASFQRSFLAERGIRLATARAGNVIGGGDWAADRLLPDLLRAFAERRSALLRRPAAVRPWQHVLEPLSGYLLLAQALHAEERTVGAWNFGPGEEDCLTAAEIAERVGALWGDGAQWLAEQNNFPHEAGILRLDASKARHRLGWQPRWRIDAALAQTVAWFQARARGEDVRRITLAQIADYSRLG